MDAYVLVRGRFAAPEAAFAHARTLIDPGCEVIGDFVLPPADGPASRDFQTLHIDFGLPVDPTGPSDVGRFTALHVPTGREATAATRIVRLDVLSAHWSDDAADRLRTSGVSTEGSFARIAEAMLTEASTLPPLTSKFLCGTEFATIEDERAFLAGLGLDVPETELVIEPGDLLVFDNLAVVHGRRGRRQPGELHQRVFGHRALSRDDQLALADAALSRLLARPQGHRAAPAPGCGSASRRSPPARTTPAA